MLVYCMCVVCKRNIYIDNVGMCKGNANGSWYCVHGTVYVHMSCVLCTSRLSVVVGGGSRGHRFIVSTIQQLLACCTITNGERGRNTILFTPSWILPCHSFFAKQQLLPCVFFFHVQDPVSIKFYNGLLSRLSTRALPRVQRRVPVCR